MYDYVDEAWKRRGKCVGGDPDVPFASGRRAQRAATAVCKGCPVLEECLTASLARRERFGVWGGLTEHQRARLLADLPPEADPRDLVRVILAA